MATGQSKKVSFRESEGKMVHKSVGDPTKAAAFGPPLLVSSFTGFANRAPCRSPPTLTSSMTLLAGKSAKPVAAAAWMTQSTPWNGTPVIVSIFDTSATYERSGFFSSNPFFLFFLQRLQSAESTRFALLILPFESDQCCSFIIKTVLIGILKLEKGGVPKDRT